MNYDVSADSDGTVRITVAGELDVRAVPALEAAAAPTMAGGPDRIVVNAGALEFVDSSAIALFVRWANHARYLEIHDPPSFLRGLILRTGLAQRIVIGPTPETPTPKPA